MDRCWTVGEVSPVSNSLVRHAESGNSGLGFPGRSIRFTESAPRGFGASDCHIQDGAMGLDEMLSLKFN